MVDVWREARVIRTRNRLRVFGTRCMMSSPHPPGEAQNHRVSKQTTLLLYLPPPSSTTPTPSRTASMLVPPHHPALPVVKTLADCASWSKTVEPYLPNLYTLPATLSAAGASAAALQHLYLTTNPLVSATAFTIATFPIFFLVSEINKNYSQVDRVWSILPTLYHIHYSVWAHLNGLECGRVDNVLAFSVVWSLRLTFNYWRKGGYEIGSEDYRWLIIKDKIGSLGFVVLNVVFISTAQIVSLLPPSPSPSPLLTACAFPAPPPTHHHPNLHPPPHLPDLPHPHHRRRRPQPRPPRPCCLRVLRRRPTM